MLVEVSHPLIRHHLTRLRDVQTAPPEFRRLVERLAFLLAYEATKNLESEPVRVTTPLEETDGARLNRSIALVPILRAGLGMVAPVLDLIPTAEVRHLGLYRDEETARPVEYYSKLDEAEPVNTALVLDPMLATGGSATAALEELREWGVRNLKLLSIIAAPEGLSVVERDFPEAQVYVCSIDRGLNEQKFIMPGLGDAGDRIFNTL